MEKETILTEEQLTQLTDVLENSRNETDQLLLDIEKEHENDDNSNGPLESGVAEFVNGVALNTNEESDYEIPDIDIDNIDMNEVNETLEKMIDNNIQDAVIEKYGLEGEQAFKFANIIIDIRHNKNVKNIYESLPEQIKEKIDEVTAQQGNNLPKGMSKKVYKEYLSKVILQELIKEMELDAIDLEKAMQDLVPTPTEMYSETSREYIEDKFPEVAEKIKEDYPENAKRLMDMRQGYMDAYTFEPMYELFKKSKIVKTVRRSEVLWSRIDQQYRKIAEVCKFNLYPLNDISEALTKLNFTETQAKRIATLFVYTYTDGVEDFVSDDEYNDIYRNSFANYFEANVKNLALSPNMISDFSKVIKDNLVKLCDHIDSVISEKEAELSNMKKKKKEGD